MDIGYLLSFNLKNMYFIEDSPENKHSQLGKQSLILYSSTTFWQDSQANALIYVSGKSTPFAYQSLTIHPIKPQYRGLIYQKSSPRFVSKSLFILT